ncbi:hypothetical protein AV545_20085 [Paenibacillus jamilae]|uniref:hypothetical protein n=1 Tax=Paenibacillus jamilae TaxID=114136 RepID=UPI0007ABE3C7|nr:hypothetical protein [Paenibacillus jamilae]KZE70784.1 hypothetical protein AV545_20085 [Paenibacillus jamilae]
MKADQQRLIKSLEGVERQIDNIVNAVAGGLNNPTILEKLSSLEQQKIELETKLLEVQQVKEKAAITEDTLRQLLSGFQDHIISRNLPEIKKFIGSYVEKVIVYQAHVEVIFKLQVVDLNNGGGRIKLHNNKRKSAISASGAKDDIKKHDTNFLNCDPN